MVVSVAGVRSRCRCSGVWLKATCSYNSCPPRTMLIADNSSYGRHRGRVDNALRYRNASGLVDVEQTKHIASPGLLVIGLRRTGHITPTLSSLHWLPIRQRMTYKLTTLMPKCLNGRAPRSIWRSSVIRASTDVHGHEIG